MYLYSKYHSSTINVFAAYKLKGKQPLLRKKLFLDIVVFLLTDTNVKMIIRILHWGITCVYEGNRRFQCVFLTAQNMCINLVST